MANPTSDLIPQDIASIAAAHDSIKQELTDLKALAQPLLTSSQKKSPHFSWAAAKDGSVGPGSYNISGELGRDPQLSLHRGSQQAVFPRAGLGKKGNKESLTPAPGSYSPSTKLVYKTDPKISFSGTEFTRLSYLEELKTRSPGPIYSFEDKKLPGGHISTSKRDTFRHFVRNNFPSPQDYSFDVKSKTMCGRFGTSKKSAYLKESLPGIDRLLKGREGELTTHTEAAPASGNGLLKCSGHIDLVNRSIISPGVGSYSSETLKSDRGKFSFPKAIRRTDLRLK